MVKRVLKFLTLSVCLLILSTSSVMAEDPVYFPDANLKAAVESELGITDPTPTDMLSLTLLYANSRGIVYLTGIEYATNLTDLYLWGNRINNISPLSGLTNLTRLDLSANQVTDISALSGLASLTELNLNNNQIVNISPLSGLINLTVLDLNYNQISDISPLSGLTSLWGLYLYNNPLNVEAYCTYLPLIEDNNPGIDLMYDPNPYPPEACLDDDGVPNGLFSIEGTQWQSLPIGMIIFPITDIGEVPFHEVGFYDGKVYFYGEWYEPASEKLSFYMDMLVVSFFMYTGESCRMPGGCYDFIVFGIMQPMGVGVMMVSNGLPIPYSVGGLLLVKTEDNWIPPEDEPTTE